MEKENVLVKAMDGGLITIPKNHMPVWGLPPAQKTIQVSSAIMTY
jgi:hypothetical protein